MSILPGDESCSDLELGSIAYSQSVCATSLIKPVERTVSDPPLWPVAQAWQGLTLVHFSAQLERFSLDRGSA